MDTKKLRQKILDLAIHGKLVPQDPNDEPASILLERIRVEKERLIKEGKIKRSKKSASDTPHYENVPQSWVICKLADVCYFESGYAFSSDDYCQSGTPLVRISNIIDSRISLESCVYINSKCDIRFHVKKGDLLIAMSGATTGKMGVYDSDETAFLNQRVGNIKVINENVLLNEYRNIFMYSQIDYILELAYGGAQPNISANIICNLPIPIPSIEEQKRIVTAVGKWFSLIDTLETAKKVLQTSIVQAKSRILDLAIHGKLVPQEPNDEPAIELLKRINPKFTPCDNAHYENVPDSWCVVPLGNICCLNEGQPFTNKEYLYIDVKGLRTGNYASKQSGKYVPAGTTFILVDGENSGEVFHTPVEGYQGSTMKVLEIESKMNAQYVLYFVKLYQKALRENKVGSAIPHLNKKMFRELIIPIPPKEEQERIVGAIQQHYRILDDISADL